MSRVRPWVVGVLAAACVLAGLPGPAAAGPAPQVHDHCGGQCNDIMPPGAEGNFTLTDIIGNRTLGTKPPHTDDETAPYAKLADDYKNLTDRTISQYFNSSALGVPADQVESTVTPRPDVRIVRDKAAGIPHVFGTTRSGTEYGAGYAAAQDRLWVMDLSRHLGRGDVTSFVGGGEANRTQEQQLWRQAPYTEKQLQAQVDRMASMGKRGKQALADVKDYVAGLNAAIAHLNATRTFPGTYDLTGHVLGAKPFTVTDLVAIATVIGAQFGNGGGTEVTNALAKEAFDNKYGAERGDAMYAAFREENDPEAVTTVHDGHSFPYGASPAHPTGVAMPDAGSVTEQPIAFGQKGSAAANGAQVAPPAEQAKAPANAPKGVEKLRGSANGGAAPDLMSPRGKEMSNALLVSAKHSQGGHPVAVMGPQTGYFLPQPLMLEELEGPGISARGAAFAGLSMYVLLGRGQDYSWSTTSGVQDVTDTYAVPLCEESGKAPTQNSTSYLYHGTCTPMQPIEHDDSWCPNFIDQTACGSYQLIAYRTNYGLVSHRGTVGGKPVAFTRLRSTYQHEVDSVIGFQEFNDPGFMRSPQAFQQASANINFTFNWVYADSAHIAYFNSGADPQRPANADPDLPQQAIPANEWKGFRPSSNDADYLPNSAHPQSVDQDYIVSWNNKQAPGYTSGVAGEGSVQRVDLIDDGVKNLIKGGHKATRADLTKVMEAAAGGDTRADYTLPTLLKVIDSGGAVTDPDEANAVAELRAWQQHGGRRQESAPGSKQYADSDAIRLMDAWWPLLVSAEFQPSMGDGAYQAMSTVEPTGNPPYLAHHQGSVFFVGWGSYVNKDVHAVLGDTVQAPLPQKFCGGGNLASCRTTLLDSLKQATTVTADKVYPGDAACKAGDQWCGDALYPQAWGGINPTMTTWQNRPTFQQVVQYTSHG